MQRPIMRSEHRPKWKTLLAFAIIYFLWGSTFLAIRVGVREVPPLLLAAMRFLVAGLALYGWMIAHGERSPTVRQWRSACLLAILIFVVDYGLLFWAEQRVPSGIAAVMMATIPAFMALSEILFLRTQRLTGHLAVALLIGMGGVAVLMSRSLGLGGAPIDQGGAVALIVASMSWSVSSAPTRKGSHSQDFQRPLDYRSGAGLRFTDHKPHHVIAGLYAGKFPAQRDCRIFFP